MIEYYVLYSFSYNHNGYDDSGWRHDDYGNDVGYNNAVDNARPASGDFL